MRSMGLCAVVVLAVGCGRKAPPVHEWGSAISFVADQLEHHYWSHGTLPSDEEAFRKQLLASKHPDALKPWQSVTWRRVKPTPSTAIPGLDDIEFTFEDASSGARRSLTLHLLLRPRDQVWSVHKYYDQDGELRVPNTDENLADLMAEVVWFYKRLKNKWPPRDHHFGESSLCAYYRNMEVAKSFSFDIVRVAGVERIQVTALKTGTKYLYPADGPESVTAPVVTPAQEIDTGTR